MREADIQFLTSPAGRVHLQQLTPDDLLPERHVQTASALRAAVGPEEAQAILETALLRQRAADKFARASEMLFVRDALEQATGEVVADYRAGRFARAGFNVIADLGCGIGGDALALAAVAQVFGIERDLLRLRLARHNLAVYQREVNFHPICADLTEIAPLAVEAFFADPARRTTSTPRAAPSRRLTSLYSYQPPWPVFATWLSRVPHAAVKVSPGLDYAEIPVGASLELVSLHGEVKEAILWFGDLRSGAARQATILPAQVTLSSSGEEPEVAVSEPLAYLYEPDGAVIRAHLVRTLAAELAANLLDPTIAYLTSDLLRETPFARAYKLEAALPFQLKRLRHYLREHHVGEVIVKKRGSPLDPDDLRRALRLSGSEKRIVFLTQVSNKPFALIGQAI